MIIIFKYIECHLFSGAILWLEIIGETYEENLVAEVCIFIVATAPRTCPFFVPINVVLQTQDGTASMLHLCIV